MSSASAWMLAKMLAPGRRARPPPTAPRAAQFVCAVAPACAGALRPSQAWAFPHTCQQKRSRWRPPPAKASRPRWSRATWRASCRRAFLDAVLFLCVCAPRAARSPRAHSAHSPEKPRAAALPCPQEMASSRDLGEARERAARTLSAFEAELRDKALARRGGAGGGGSAEAGAVLEAAMRENAILKRAVAIQNTRHQARRLDSAGAVCDNALPSCDASCDSKGPAAEAHFARSQEFAAAAEAENGALRRQLAATQEELQAAQLSNYALNLHLREATSQAQFPSQRNPDVF